MTSDTESNSGGLWKGDKLDRKHVGRFLKKYLNNKFEEEAKRKIDSSFVLNINAGWGCGKTFLMKHWANEIRNEGYCVIEFNAWDTDFSDDPLLAFISSISDQLKAQLGDNASAGKVDALVKTATSLFKSATPFLLSILTKKLTGMGLDEIYEQFDDTEESKTESEDTEEKGTKESADKNTEESAEKIGADDILAKLVSKVAEQKLKEHKLSEDAIQRFKKNLEGLINTIKDKQDLHLPLYIFIDELDRCRPNYAIELLENIKHLFGVHGVYFVVATDSEELCHSIKAVYGAGFDSEKYLKRFFDQEFEIPEPNFQQFANFLASKLGEPEPVIKQFFFPVKQNLYPTIKEIFPLYAKAFSLDLRSQEQCYTKFEALRTMAIDNNFMHLGYLLPLIMIRHFSNSLYKRYCIEGLPPLLDSKLLEGMKTEEIKYTQRSSKGPAHKQTTIFEIFNIYDTLQENTIAKLYHMQESSRDEIKNNIIRTLNGKVSDDDRPCFHYYKDQVKYYIGQLK